MSKYNVGRVMGWRREWEGTVLWTKKLLKSLNISELFFFFFWLPAMFWCLDLVATSGLFLAA